MYLTPYLISYIRRPPPLNRPRSHDPTTRVSSLRKWKDGGLLGNVPTGARAAGMRLVFAAESGSFCWPALLGHGKLICGAGCLGRPPAPVP